MNYYNPLESRGNFPPIVKYLIVANSVVFILQWILDDALIPLFALTPHLVQQKLWVWQLLTYMFLHGDFWHLFFNMFTLWMFGSELERDWGSGEFLKYYFITGIGAGVCNFLVSMDSSIPIIGASGAIYGILIAYGLLYPDRIIYVFFLLPIKARYFVIILGLIEFWSSIGSSHDGVAHFAHLGGMIVGLIYLKVDWKLIKSHIPQLKKRKFIVVDSKEELLTEEDIELKKMRDKVDIILDKISQVGLNHISEEERKFLERASKILKQKH